MSPRTESFLDANEAEVKPGPESFLARFVANNWKVAIYVLLIVLCVLFAPEEPLKFIYTEF